MEEPVDKIKLGAAKLETPLAIRHVESHLVFGPLSRHFPLAYIALGLGVLNLLAAIFAGGPANGQHIGSIFDKVFYLIVPFLLLRMTYRQQAIVGWMATKFAFGLGAFMLVTIGAGASFRDNKADAWPNLLLGLIWIPGIEFIPKVTPHQRYVTLARIVLSIPCIYFGVKSGNWHW